MEKLKKAHLFMAGLIPVNGLMVNRYNRALMKLGIPPTQLSSFTVDGIGWSPEIAEEKENINYLNHGGANPYGIILFPEQQKKPIYVPYHSFDREAIDIFFQSNQEEITEITKETSIIVHINQHMLAFYDISDLMDYDEIEIGYVITNELDQKQKDQILLIDQMNDVGKLLDLNHHNKLLSSVLEFGDLRKRKIQLQEIVYKTKDFYTKAFGGVFVLRGENVLVICESRDFFKKSSKELENIYHISDPKLLDVLVKNKYVYFDLEGKQDRVTRIKQYFFMKIVKEREHEFAEIFSNEMIYKRYMANMSEDEKILCNGVDVFLTKIKKDKNPNRDKYIKSDVFTALHSAQNNNPVVWKLLSRMFTNDPLMMYYYDKETFYAQYKEWSESFQNWVIELISKELETIKN